MKSHRQIIGHIMTEKPDEARNGAEPPGRTVKVLDGWKKMSKTVI